MKKIALVLLGAGHKDGSEITETVSAIIALSELKTQIDYFSFNIDVPCASHPELKRNALAESQRISRGKSQDISTLNPLSYDALVIPGGSGILLHLTNWSEKNIHFSVHEQLAKVIESFYEKSKPIGAICIAPLLVAQVLKKNNPIITLGETSDIIPLLNKTTIQHEVCPTNDFITDRDCKIISTPAYMNQASASDVYTGIRLMVKELVEMA